jgi:hypothetical protein
MINGQFVTLYSVNGLTWLSSPEDIPDTMARLDNTRITLSEEKAPEAEKGQNGEKGDKGDKGDKGEKAAAPAPKIPGSQYRMKGPKPRPILRQGGKVVEGTPIEPVSASAVNIKGAADMSLPQVKLSPMEQGIRRGKIVAPIAQRRPGKPKVTPPPAKKVVAPPAKSVPPVKAAPAGKGKAPASAPAKAATPVKVVKGGKAPAKVAAKPTKETAPTKALRAKAAPVKAPKAAPKKMAKPMKAAKKAAPKKTVAKKSARKATTKKRSR